MMPGITTRESTRDAHTGQITDLLQLLELRTVYRPGTTIRLSGTASVRNDNTGPPDMIGTFTVTIQEPAPGLAPGKPMLR